MKYWIEFRTTIGNVLFVSEEIDDKSLAEHIASEFGGTVKSRKVYS